MTLRGFAALYVAIAAPPAYRGSAPPDGWSRLEGRAKASFHVALERRLIQSDAQVPSPGDRATAAREEHLGESHGISHSHPQHEMEFPGRGERDQRTMGNAPRDATPGFRDALDLMAADDVVCPASRRIDCK